MSKKMKFFYILLSLFLAVFLVIKLNDFINNIPNTDKSKIEQQLVDYVHKYIDKDSVLKKFEVTGDNSLEGVYGLHKVIMKTKDGMLYEVYVTNDLIKNNIVKEENIYNDFAFNRMHFYLESKAIELYGDLELFKVKDNNIDAIAYTLLTYDYEEDEHIDDYIEKNKKENEQILEFMDKNKDTIVKNHMVIDLILETKTNNKISDSKEKDINDFYNYYEKLTSKYDESFDLNIALIEYYEDVDNKELDLDYDLSKEEILHTIKNFDKEYEKSE